MTDQYPSDLQPKSMPGLVFERWKSVIGIMAASIIAYAAMGAMWIFWRDVQGWNLELTGNLILAVIGASFILMLLYVCTRIVVAALSGRKEIVLSQDRILLEPLIQDANEKAIDQYVRLSSLTGATGVATKLGLTGLPLITVALTLIFAGLELYKPSGGFMDLTKLTLGAFIGSFVQRTATTQAVVATGRIPPA